MPTKICWRCTASISACRCRTTWPTTRAGARRCARSATAWWPTAWWWLPRPEIAAVVANGVVVVTAAGNRGFNKLAQPEGGAAGDYRYISITDPGNADSVITVGSTHRFMPHSYGVSYFSSRGPTGDGRTKPDLVAPGERIDSCVPGGDYDTMDGTSMAAAHVSGAAALLIGRYRELIGQPKRVKEILVKSATDLDREPRFQGAGMLDVLRALQSL